MKTLDSASRSSKSGTHQVLSSEDLKELTAQLQSAYPTATEKLLLSAIEECRKESREPDNREKLIRCVVERITT